MAPDQRLELGVLAQRSVAIHGKAFDQPEARVVPRPLVAVSRVAEPYYEFHMDR